MLFLFCEWTERNVLASELASLANMETPLEKHERWLWFLEARRNFLSFLQACVALFFIAAVVKTFL